MNKPLQFTPLPRDFYDRDTVIVAQELLGAYLVHDNGRLKRVGKIVEVEAYLGTHDLACHAAKGRTKRTEIMFGAPGYAYVYLIYGMYHCFNVVTEKEGIAAAVLLRALEPIQHISARTEGPGLLSKAMEIDKSFNGFDMTQNTLYIARRAPSSFNIVAKPRIGVHYAQQWAQELLRFYIAENAFVSKR